MGKLSRKNMRMLALAALAGGVITAGVAIKCYSCKGTGWKGNLQCIVCNGTGRK